MPAYVIAVMSIDDPLKYAKYTDRTPEIIKRYGGKFLTRGEDVLTLEGAQPEGRTVILEFPNQQKVKDWYASSEYQEVVQLRWASSTMHQLIMQEGGDNTTDPSPKL